MLARIIDNDAILSMFNTGSWTERFRVVATGGFNFSDASGALIAQINHAGQVNQGSAGRSPGLVSALLALRQLPFPPLTRILQPFSYSTKQT